MWGPNPIGVRKLESLIGGLPLDGSLARVLAPETVGRGWGYQEELLAIIAEVVDVGNRNFVEANKKKGAQTPKPIFIPRPGRVQTKRKATREDLKQMFGSAIVKKKKE